MGSYPSVRIGRELTAEDRRRQVLAAAVRCLATSGYESVRLRDIAREAEVSTGLIQHYFDSREELLEAAFHHACRELIDRWVSASSRLAPWTVLGRVLDEVADPVNALTWTEFSTAAARHENLRDAFKGVYDQWRAVVGDAIDRGVEDGSFRPTLSTEEVGDILLAYVDGSLLALAARSGVTTPERVRHGWRALARELLRYESPDAD